MKELLCKYAAYNVWANHKVMYQILQMEERYWYQQTPSSFDSLYKTILHMWDSESGWWQRMRLHQTIVVPSANFDPSLKDACNGLLHQSMEWEPFINNSLNEAAIQSQLLYKNSKGDSFQQPVGEVLMHVFNHSSYHRGQLITMMRQLGETVIPQTDLIVFSRSTNS